MSGPWVWNGRAVSRIIGVKQVVSFSFVFIYPVNCILHTARYFGPVILFLKKTVYPVLPLADIYRGEKEPFFSLLRFLISTGQPKAS